MQVMSSPTGLFLHSTVINSLIVSYFWIITPTFPNIMGLIMNVGSLQMQIYNYRCLPYFAVFG